MCYLLGSGRTFPGVLVLLDGKGGGLLAWLQAGLYVAVVLGSIWFAFTYVVKRRRDLRRDSADALRITAINTSSSFARHSGSVLLIGLRRRDVISFLRVEGLLNAVAGEDLGKQLSADRGRSHWRGPYVHMPLIVAGHHHRLFHAAPSTFIWLALLDRRRPNCVIVITRFIFVLRAGLHGRSRAVLVRGALPVRQRLHALGHRYATCAWMCSTPASPRRTSRFRSTRSGLDGFLGIIALLDDPD